MEVGSRVFVPKLNQSGEIIMIRQYPCSDIHYYVLLDSDVKYKQKLKNPCGVFTKQSLEPDNNKTIQLSFFG